MRITVDTSAFGAAMKALTEATGEAAERMAVLAHGIEKLGNPRAHIRCRTCNPGGNPKPMRIDGHDYHRRMKARKRRGE
jgi:hypothetical protein